MIDPNAWFVNPSDVTTGNIVTPLIDGRSLFSEIQALIPQLGARGFAGDFCYWGAWEMVDGLILTPTNLGLGIQLQLAIERGADVRLLLFRGMPTYKDYAGVSTPVTHRTLHLDLKNRFEALGGQVIIDLKYPAVGSAHQKYVMFGIQTSPGEYVLTAFCGGIDPALERGDDAFHIRRVGEEPMDFRGWHDVAVKIEGAAAESVLQDFVQRWNDHPLDAIWNKTATSLIDTSVYHFAPLVVAGNQRVEVLTTYHCSKWLYTHELAYLHVYYSFAGEDGIHTILDAYLRAIANAQHYIYIENYCFFDPAIASALRDRLNENSELQVILLTGDIPFQLTHDLYYLRQTIEIVREATNAGDHFHLCKLRHPDGARIYVHSKLMIVDDLYYTVGSANITPRSMTHDCELNIGAFGDDLLTYDEGGAMFTVSQAVRDFRVTLWKEHLQVDAAGEEQLLRIPLALTTWMNGIGTLPSRVETESLLLGDPHPLWHILPHPAASCG